jgi:single-strand selective monofunctional uracil DNA glycosylase
MPIDQTAISKQLVAAARRLCKQVDALDLSAGAPWIYNPLNYAWLSHKTYLEMYAPRNCQVLFLGMNPGPWGMSQTGIPFGEVSMVRDYLGIKAKIGKPAAEHPKRPILGLNCARQEVSGQRFWGFFRSHFARPSEFFTKHFVTSYCPLAFMDESGSNVTPDKLPAQVRKVLEPICDDHLASILRVLNPKWLIGVGAWAQKCAERVVSASDVSGIRIGKILHPSPASPAANRDWPQVVYAQLIDQGVWSKRG